jgi:hypothetical protein
MHVNDHGLGGKHLLPEIKKCILALGKKSVKVVDTEYVNCLSLLQLSNLIFYLSEWLLSHRGQV